MSDEPPHLASGLSYVSTGVFRGNPQHPPLLKELSGLSLLLGGIRWPRNPASEAFLRGEFTPGSQPDWDIGRELIIANGPDRTMFWARLPMILVACLLGAVLFLWCRALFGGIAATGAVLLFATDPTILAHSFSVTMDVGLTAFTMLFLFALWRYLQEPTRQRLVLAGLSLGAVLAAKFSAVFLLPVAAVLLLAALIWPVPKEAVAAEPVPSPRDNDPCPCGSRKKYKVCHGAKPSLALPSLPDAARRLGVWATMCAIALVLVHALYFFPRDPFVYLHGLEKVNADHNPLFMAYLADEVASRFPAYFAAAYLLKEPLATLILAAIGLAVLLWRRGIPVPVKLFLLFPPAVFFLGTSIGADNLGVRYIMPVLAFGHLLGGLGLATLLTSGAKAARWTAIGLCAWAVVATCGIAPDHLSYFNESACLLRAPERLGLDGGSQCGTFWLDDSNVDWNQGMKQLKTWLDRNAPDATVRVGTGYLSFPASAYGIRSEMADQSELTGRPIQALYAVSASLVARFPAHRGTSDWLRRVRPRAVVGHAFYVYDLRPRF
jgi:hypothetical protein